MRTQLEQLGVARMSHGISGNLLSRAARAFVALITNVPHEDLMRALYTLDIPHFTPYGYTRKKGEWKTDQKTGTREWHDPKRYLHIDGKVWPHLPIVLELARTHPEMRTFRDAFLSLHRALVPLMKKVLGEFDDIPGFSSNFLDEAGLPSELVVRLNAYDACTNHTEMLSAQEHVDQGGFTATLWESHPGLYMRLRNGTVLRPQWQPGESLVMVGKQAEILTEGMLEATPHGVEQSRGIVGVSREISRISIVAFQDAIPEKIPIPDYNATHPKNAFV